MASSFDISRNYDWIPCITSDRPDMRCKKNRDNIAHMADQLGVLLEKERSDNKLLKERITALTKTRSMKRAAVELDEKEKDTYCLICTEPMQGKVSLKCGHELCPECYAKHARLNNTCPFCRDEFAPKPKIREKLPDESVAVMTNNMFDPVVSGTPPTYFVDLTSRIISEGGGENSVAYLEYIMKTNMIIIGRQVMNWYNAE